MLSSEPAIKCVPFADEGLCLTFLTANRSGWWLLMVEVAVAIS